MQTKQSRRTPSLCSVDHRRYSLDESRISLIILSFAYRVSPCHTRRKTLRVRIQCITYASWFTLAPRIAVGLASLPRFFPEAILLIPAEGWSFG
jgi:hypothetical protein